LLERGQRVGSLGDDIPAEWQLSMLALVHAASGEVHARRANVRDAESRLAATALAAVGAAGAVGTM
jgi:hypothetical protein